MKEGRKEGRNGERKTSRCCVTWKEDEGRKMRKEDEGRKEGR
jgi:hypothetical protein